MRRNFSLVFLFLILAVTALAQTPTPTPTPEPVWRQTVTGRLFITEDAFQDSTARIDRKTDEIKFFDLNNIAGVTLSRLRGASNVITVGADGCDYTTIQAAVDAAADGDTILIAPGTYTEQVTLSGRTLTLRGLSWDSHITYTNATNDYTGATIRIQGGSTVKIENLQVTNPGVANAGGVAVGAGGTFNPSVIIKECKLNGYQDTVWNGNSQMYVYGCEINGGFDTVTQVTQSSGRDLRVENCYISALDATNHVPLWFFGPSDLYVSNCLIYTVEGLIKVADGATGDIYFLNNAVIGGGAAYATPVNLLGTWTGGDLFIAGSNVATWPSANTSYYTVSGNNLILNGTERISAAGVGTFAGASSTEPISVTKATDASVNAFAMTNSSTGVSAQIGIRMDGSGGGANARVFGGGYTGLTNWQDSFVISADTGLDGGVVFYSADKIRFQNTAVGTDNWILTGGNVKQTGSLEIETGATFGAAGLLLDQDDTDMPFVKFEGTAGDVNGSANIYSGDVTNDGATFPTAAIKVNVGGTDYWLPLYAIPAP